MQITWTTKCSECGKRYKNPNSDHEGKLVRCRECGAYFVMELIAPHGNVGAKYDLCTKDEIEEEYKRANLPMGMLWDEFIQLLKRPAIIEKLCLTLGNIRGVAVKEDDMARYIDYLEFERERIRSSFD